MAVEKVEIPVSVPITVQDKAEIDRLQAQIRTLKADVDNYKSSWEQARIEAEQFEAALNRTKHAQGVDVLEAQLRQFEQTMRRSKNEFTAYLKTVNLDDPSIMNSDEVRAIYKKIEEGCYTAGQAITEFKTKFQGLLQENYSSGNTFGSKEFNTLSTNLDSLMVKFDDLAKHVSELGSGGISSGGGGGFAGNLADQIKQIVVNAEGLTDSGKDAINRIASIVEAVNSYANVDSGRLLATSNAFKAIADIGTGSFSAKSVDNIVNLAQRISDLNQNGSFEFRFDLSGLKDLKVSSTIHHISGLLDELQGKDLSNLEALSKISLQGFSNIKVPKPSVENIKDLMQSMDQLTGGALFRSQDQVGTTVKDLTQVYEALAALSTIKSTRADQASERKQEILEIVDAVEQEVEASNREMEAIERTVQEKSREVEAASTVTQAIEQQAEAVSSSMDAEVNAVSDAASKIEQEMNRIRDAITNSYNTSALEGKLKRKDWDVINRSLSTRQYSVLNDNGERETLHGLEAIRSAALDACDSMAQMKRIGSYFDALFGSPVLSAVSEMSDKVQILRDYINGNWQYSGLSTLFKMFVEYGKEINQTFGTEFKLYDFISKFSDMDFGAMQAQMRGMSALYPQLVNYTSTFDLDSVTLRNIADIENDSYNTIRAIAEQIVQAKLEQVAATQQVAAALPAETAALDTASSAAQNYASALAAAMQAQQDALASAQQLAEYVLRVRTAYQAVADLTGGNRLALPAAGETYGSDVQSETSRWSQYRDVILEATQAKVDHSRTAELMKSAIDGEFTDIEQSNERLREYKQLLLEANNESERMRTGGSGAHNFDYLRTKYGEDFDRVLDEMIRASEAQRNFNDAVRDGAAAASEAEASEQQYNNVLAQVSNALRNVQTNMHTLSSTPGGTARPEYAELEALEQSLSNLRANGASMPFSTLTESLSRLKLGLSDTLQQMNLFTMAEKDAAAAEKEAAASAKQQEQTNDRYLNDQKKLQDQLRQVIELKQRIANAGGQGSQQYQDLEQLEQTLRGLNNATPTELHEGLKGTALRLAEVKRAAVDAGGALSNMRSPLGMLQSRLTYMFSLSAIILKAVQSLKQMIKTTVELDSKMTELRIVTNNSESDYAAYSKTIAATAQEIGASMSDLIDSTTVYARLGNTLEDSAELARVTAMLQNVGNIDVSTAQDAITSITKAFNDVDPSNIESAMDKLVVVGNNFPISVSQLAEGFNNAGSTLAAAGNSFEQSVALLTAANTTIQNISKSSTGLRTITARIRKTKYELDDLGEVVEEASYQKALDILTGKGVKLTENGEFRATYDILKDIAAIWNELGSMQQASIAEALAGNRQQNVFYSIVEQFDEATSAMDRMQNSAGALEEAYAEYGESIQKHVDSLKAAWQGLSQSIVDSDLAKGILDFATGFVNVFDRIIEKFNVIKPLITGFVAYLIAVNAKAILASMGITALFAAVQRLAGGIAALAAGGGFASLGLSLTTAGWIGVAAAAITAIIMLVKRLAEGWQEAYLEAHPTLEMLQEDAKKAADKVNELQEKLDANNEKLAELNKLKTDGSITIVQEAEIQNLEIENDRLTEQLELYKEIAKYKAEEASEAAGKSNNNTAWRYFSPTVTVERAGLRGAAEERNTKGFPGLIDAISDYEKASSDLRTAENAMHDALREAREQGKELTDAEFMAYQGEIDKAADRMDSAREKLLESKQALIEAASGERLTAGVKAAYSAAIGKVSKALGENGSAYDPYGLGSLSEEIIEQLARVRSATDIRKIASMDAAFQKILDEHFSEYKSISAEQAFLYTFDKRALESALQSYGEGGAVDLLVRPVIDAKELVNQGWKEAGEGAATLFSSTYKNSLNTKAANFTPIFTDDQGKVHILTPDELGEYVHKVLDEGADDTLGLQIGAEFTMDEYGDDFFNQAIAVAKMLSELHGIYFADQIEAMESAESAAENVAPAIDSLTEKTKQYKEALDTIAKAQKEAFSDTGLSMDSVNALKEIFAEIDEFDPEELFEITANGIHLNTEELELLTKALSSKQLADLDQQIKDRREELEALREKLGDVVDSIHSTEDAVERFGEDTSDWDKYNALQEEISDMEMLRAEIDGATSAYYRYLQAKEQPDKRERYGRIGSDYEGIGELIEQGWSGDAEVDAYLDYVLGSGRSGDNVSDYQRLSQKIAGTNYAITDFFTKDANGNSTPNGIYNLLDAMEQIGQSEGWDFVQQMEDGSWDIDLRGDNLDKVANKLGLTREAVEDILRASEDIDGTHLEWDDTINPADAEAEAERIKNSLHDTEKALSEVFGETIEVPEIKGTETFDELKNKLEQLKKAYSLLNLPGVAEEGGIKDVEQKIKDLDTVIKAVEEKIHDLQNKPHEVTVTPTVDTENLPEEVTPEEENPVTLPVEADPSLAEEKIDEFRAAQEADPILLPVSAQPTVTTPTPTQAPPRNTPKPTGAVITDTVVANTKSADADLARVSRSIAVPLIVVPNLSLYDAAMATITKPVHKTVIIDTTGGDDDGGGGSQTIAQGTAHAAGSAYLGGDWGVKHPGISLVGEVGPEIRVRGSHWSLLGKDSSELADIRKGDIIFNAEQTRQILANGKITNGLKRGVAYVSGTIPGRRSVAPDYHYTNPGNSAVGNATQNDKNKQKIDWIEVAVDRIERIIESMTRSVESVFLRLEKRLQASADAIAKTREEIELARAGADRYFEEAEKVDLSEEIKNLIRNGAIDIAEYDKKTADKIKEYQEWYRTMPLYMVTYIENFI